MQVFDFGQPALFALFRGGGNLLTGTSGSGDSGIDTLNSRLRDTFSDFFLVSQVFDSYEGTVFNFQEVGSDRGRAFVDRFDNIDAFGFIGYSAGGLSTIRLAQSLAPQTVDLLVQLDSYEPLTGTSPEDEVLPSNVTKGINYFQNANPLNITDLQGARNVQGSENINVETLLGDDSITHLSIEENAALQSEILTNIEEFVLQDLTFDPTGQIALSGGAQFTANVLALASAPNKEIGEALIAQSIALSPDFSFSTRFQFRMTAANPAVLPGLSFWVQPATETAADLSPLAIAFTPTALTTPSIAENAVAVLTPDIAPAPLSQAITPLDLDSGDPLTAWVNYDGPTDQLAVFLSDTLIQPSAPLLTSEVDLFAIAGDVAQFGFRAIVGDAPRQADLLTWQLTTAEGNLSLAQAEPYLNLGLTQRVAANFLGREFSFTPFEVNGLDFSALFDEIAYLQSYPDVLRAVAAGTFTTGYEHFVRAGWLEGRRPSSLFDEDFYLLQNPDVARAVAAERIASGFAHFARFGHVEGRDPSAAFDQDAYLLNNPDVARAVNQRVFRSAFEHYIEAGAGEGRDPQLLLFQEGYYLTEYPDVARAVAAGNYTDGFDHYLTYGCREGRNPTAFFDEDQYLTQNPDVAAAVAAGRLPCGWTHYLAFGRFEGRSL